MKPGIVIALCVPPSGSGHARVPSDYRPLRAATVPNAKEGGHLRSPGGILPKAQGPSQIPSEDNNSQHKLFITSYPVGDEEYNSHIYAASFDEAKKVATLRGLGEIVDGVTEPYSDEPENLPAKIHEACFLGYVALKAGTITVDELLGDKGVLHEAIHLMCGDPDANAAEIEEGLARLRSKVPGYIAETSKAQ